MSIGKRILRTPADMMAAFIRLEGSGGFLLMAAAALALLVENSGFQYLYDQFQNLRFTIALGDLGLSKPLVLWINDGLMAVFFLLVGLEIKREMLCGQLSSRDQIVMPVVAAIGGMAAPAIIYTLIVGGDAVLTRGWAIPAATDIAFSLGVLALLGSRVPLAMKVFLTTVAVIDDLGAIIVIALFYTSSLSLLYLALAFACLALLVMLNRNGVTSLAPYIAIGVVMWVFVLKSGVHATLAGVALGMLIPMQGEGEDDSPLTTLEHALHPWVAYFILPLFAFVNAGIPLAGLSLADLVAPLPLAIMMGLFLGKQVGIFGFCFLASKLKLAKPPAGLTWLELYGTAALCGIGFTMSLFIGGLAFEDDAFSTEVRMGILSGSILSAFWGYFVLRYALSKRTTATAPVQA